MQQENLPIPTPFDAEAYVAALPWRAIKEGGPYDRDGLRHEYVVWWNLPEDLKARWEPMRQHIREHGYRRKFGRRHTYTYLDVGPHRVWMLWRVMNRCDVHASWDDPREPRLFEEGS